MMTPSHYQTAQNSYGQIPMGNLLRVGTLSSERLVGLYNRSTIIPLPRRTILIVMGLAYLSVMIVSMTFALGIYGSDPAPLRRAAESIFSLTSQDDLSSKRVQARQARVASQVTFVSDLIRSVKPRNGQIKRMAAAIVRQSELAGYDPLLVAAVIKAESTFRPQAESPVGALGLMQLLPSTAHYISQKSHFTWQGSGKLTQDFDYNIRLGVAYLQYLERKFNGDMRSSLIAYNWGPGKMQRALAAGRPAPASTQAYADTILADYSRWNAHYRIAKGELGFEDNAPRAIKAQQIAIDLNLPHLGKSGDQKSS